MAHIIEITDFSAPELDIYARLTENQLVNRADPENALFVAESPLVIGRALDAGCTPVSFLMERKHIEGKGAEVLARCPADIPVYAADLPVLTQLTGFHLTRGMLCAMRRPRLPSVAEVCANARRIAVLENIMNPTNIGAIFRSAAALNVDAVLLTAAVTLLAGIGAPPGPVTLAGMVILSSGCLLMPLMRWNQFRPASYRSGALKFIVIAAAGTTGYTIFDSMAIRLVRASVEQPGLLSSMAYLFLIEAGLALMLLFAVSCSISERQEFRKLFRKTKTPVISGIFSSTAYILILIAMTHVTNVSYIQAFRQMSLPIGVLAGIFLLHEKPGRPRLAGIALVITGLVVVAVGS